jgi:hypothetical protein
VGDARYNDRLNDFSPQAVAAGDGGQASTGAVQISIDGIFLEELLNKELMIGAAPVVEYPAQAGRCLSIR